MIMSIPENLRKSPKPPIPSHKQKSARKSAFPDTASFLVAPTEGWRGCNTMSSTEERGEDEGMGSPQS
jgi:hypothetical protein